LGTSSQHGGLYWKNHPAPGWGTRRWCPRCRRSSHLDGRRSAACVQRTRAPTTDRTTATHPPVDVGLPAERCTAPPPHPPTARWKRSACRAGPWRNPPRTRRSTRCRASVDLQGGTEVVGAGRGIPHAGAGAGARGRHADEPTAVDRRGRRSDPDIITSVLSGTAGCRWRTVTITGEPTMILFFTDSS
jgi:hypothetical protein